MGEDIISTAKKNRLNRLRQAKEKAEEELVTFRAEQDAKFQKEVGSKKLSDPASALESSTKAELQNVDRDYNANKAATVDYVSQKVFDVKISLTTTQIQALKQRIA